MKSIIKAWELELEKKDWRPVVQNIIDFMQDKIRLSINVKYLEYSSPNLVVFKVK